MTTSPATSSRPPLTRDRVLRAAVDLADREGLGALTMRRLGADLGVEAMSLYKHVANKEAILDGVVELIFGEIEIPTEAAQWKQAMRRRACSAREVLASHSWAIGLMESRGSMGSATMRYLEAMLGILRAAGFSIEDAVHALWLLDSFVYGHVIQEAGLSPVRTSPPGTEPAGNDREPDLGEYPHLAELMDSASRSEFSLDQEFAYGLERILASLDSGATVG